GVAQCTQVVRHQVLGPIDKVGELAHAPVAAGQLAEQRPPLRVGDELEELECGSLLAAGGHVERLHQSGLMHSGGVVQADDCLLFRFSATASRTRLLRARLSILSLSLMSIARLTFPSRLELN